MTTPRFSDALREAMRERLGRFERRAVPSGASGSGTPAAVALVVVPGEDRESAAVLLTLRASGLRRHGGQWALPGGRLEPGETPETGALREVEEEIGLTLPAGHVLGLLDDYPTRSGFAITPVVVWGDGSARLRPDPNEVAGIYRVPLEDLVTPENLFRQSIPQSDRPVLALSILSTLIYAPTAAILHQFGEVAVLGRDTRVDHYEQPVFAWR